MANIMLLPSKCTYISSSKPDTNFAVAGYLYAGTDFYGAYRRILLAFDLFFALPDMMIENATFSMYASCMRGKNTGGFFAPYFISSRWAEEKVTWNGQPRLNASVMGKLLEISSDGWYSWDMTEMVRMWVLDEKSNNGLLIKSLEDKAADFKRFFPVHSVYDRKYRPCLEIQYNVANSFPLRARYITSIFEITGTWDTWSFSSWQNTSTFSMYSFFVQNTGTSPVTVFAQVSPDKRMIFNEPAIFTIAPEETEVIIPSRYGFFSRLAFKSFAAGNASALHIWFQAQV